ILPWVAMFAPGKTPPEIVERLAREVAAAMKRPDVREGLERAAFEPESSTPQELGDFLQAQLKVWGTVAREAGLAAHGTGLYCANNEFAARRARVTRPIVKPCVAIVVAASAAAGLVDPAQADPVEDFYRGKTINLYIGTTPGGGYDIYARLVGRF